MTKKENIEIADFTTIKHNPRVKYNLSNNDYCIASAIFTLSHNPDSIFPGWYYGKAETLGLKFDFSRATTYRSIEKLIEKELLEKNPDTNFLRTTKLWWDEFESLRLVKKGDWYGSLKLRQLSQNEIYSISKWDKTRLKMRHI